MPRLSKAKIDEQMVKNHQAYASQIQYLGDFEAIRRRPGQFIGYIGNRGVINMWREIIQNSMDEALKETSPCDTMHVEYNEETRMMSVTDNGNGIPFGEIAKLFSSTNAGSNFTPREYSFPSGMHGVGSKAVNALSKLFRVTSYECKAMSKDGKASAHRVEWYEGEIWDKGNRDREEILPNTSDYQGTVVEFIPSQLIMGDITLTVDDVRFLLNTLIPLMPIGYKAGFHGIRISGEEINEVIENKDGILTYIIASISGEPLIKPICISNVSPTMKCDIAFTYDTSNIGNECLHSFANNCPTLAASGDRQSSHTKAFYEAICTFFRNYMNKIYLANSKSKTKVIADDVRSGLNAAISVSHIDPLFSGQAKEIFSKDDVEPYLKEVINAQLEQWVKENPDDLQKLCKYLKEVADIRSKVEGERIKISIKHKSVFDGLPLKYDKPSGKDDLEFILVEGDSAMGAARKARCPRRQGLLPLRGKFKNAMSCSYKDFWTNEEAQAIDRILDCGHGKEFNINRLKFVRIIPLTDADVDGYHIRQLIQKFMLVYYRPIIELGRFYFAQPPLYSITVHGKNIYFAVLEDYVEYVIKSFSKDIVIADMSGKRISPNKLKYIIADNTEYLDLLNSAAATFSVNPLLFEFTLAHSGETVQQMQKSAKKEGFTFVKVSDENGTLVLRGDYADKVQTVLYNDFMQNKCAKLTQMLGKCPEPYFVINGQKQTLYGLMTLFRKYQPSHVQRYKGLGEMKALQLKESTLHPDYNRTLMQVTVQDIETEIRTIRELNSNLKALVENINFDDYNDI